MAKKPVSYWERRAGQRLVISETIGKRAIEKTLAIYDQAQRNIEKDLKSIYNSYAKNGLLDVAELKKAIGTTGAMEFLRKVEIKAKSLNIDATKIYDNRFLSRVTRLQEIQEQVKLEVMSIAPKEENLSTKAYTKILNEAYTGAQQDLELVGIQPSFSRLNKQVVTKILNSAWVGSNYSNRIWGNTEKLAIKLQTILGGALAMGQSYEKTASLLQERFDVARYEAVRLIRTETNYFHNQAEIQSYLDDGIGEYTLDVTLDGRTSAICLSKDESIKYKTKDAIPGVNYPPFHPQCRTVARAVLEGDQKIPSERARIQRFSNPAEDLKSQWLKAIQKQMNPNKAVYDYNAEMNILSQNLSKKIITQEKFKQQLNDLMDRVPEDYPLRGGLETVARANGWVKPNYKGIDRMLQDAGLSDSGIKFDQEQVDFINKNKIKINSVRTGTEDINGAYNMDTNTVSLDVANLKNVSNILGDKNYINEVVQHELGHAVDRFGRDNQEFSMSQDFTGIIKRNETERNAIAQYRFVQSLPDKELQSAINGMSPDVFGLMAKTSDKVQINGERYGVPREVYNYFTQNDELFAQSYTLFKNKPDWMQAKAPKLYDYFTKLFTTKDGD